MKIEKTPFHLAYCTNIHPGESWTETFSQLKKHLPKVKKQVSPHQPMGVGLRLSNSASIQILENDELLQFKEWLKENSLYIFTFNGFPYGSFHRTVVKDKVHTPDWTTNERLEYTLRLFDILLELLPNDLSEGGISTSPLSYKFWHNSLNEVYEKATLNLAKIALHLHKIKQEKDISLHLDIEPEPDGVLENTKEVIDYYKQWLIPNGSAFLAQALGIDLERCAAILREHIQLCYDVCHYAIAFEEPEEVFQAMEKEKIKIGKVQLSAALKSIFDENSKKNSQKLAFLKRFDDPTYLHQVIEKENSGKLKQYKDLPDALNHFDGSTNKEWRIHFHVPLFSASYELLHSTNTEIKKVIAYIKQSPIVKHLEIETYTWEVLPKNFQKDIDESITREMNWILQQF
ncbi:MAG: metabolite traffic protein EboE [Bacteroidota bacterium]